MHIEMRVRAVAPRKGHRPVAAGPLGINRQLRSRPLYVGVLTVVKAGLVLFV